MTSKWEGPPPYDREQTSSRIPRRSAGRSLRNNRAFGTVSTVIRVNPDGISSSRLQDKGSREFDGDTLLFSSTPTHSRGCFHRKLEVGEERRREMMARTVVRDGYDYTTIHRGRADCSCSGVDSI